MNGITRLSRRLNKKDAELSTLPTGSPPQSEIKTKHLHPPIAQKPNVRNSTTEKPVAAEKPAIRPKPMFVKRGSRKSDLTEVKQIIRRHSSGSASSAQEILPPHDKEEQSNGLINQSYESSANSIADPDTSKIKYVSKIRLSSESETEDVEVKFDNSVQSLDRNHRISNAAPPRLTPMKDHAPNISSGSLSLQSSNNVDEC